MNWKPRLPADPRTAWLKWLALLCAAGLALALRAPRLLAQDDSPTGIMLQANRLYEAGQFAEAAQTYRQLIDRGLQNQAVYYNLGNAYFKQGDLGRAILNYRRAGRLAPRAPDIRANLTLARAQTVDAIQVAGKAPLNELATLVQTWLTLNEMAALSLGLWLALALLVIARSHLAPGPRRTALQYLIAAVALLLLPALLSLGSRLVAEQTRPAAVIVAPEVDVTSGPGDQYLTEFTLHSGAEVTLIEQRDFWTRLTLPGGQLQGWVPAQTVEAVTPN